MYIFKENDINELWNMGLFSGIGTDPDIKLARQVESSKKLLKYLK